MLYFTKRLSQIVLLACISIVCASNILEAESKSEANKTYTVALKPDIVLTNPAGFSKKYTLTLVENVNTTDGLYLYYPEVTNNAGYSGKAGIFALWSQHTLKSFAIINDNTMNYFAHNDNRFLCLTKLPTVLPRTDGVNAFAMGFPSCWQADCFVDLSQYENWEKQFMSTSNGCDIGISTVDLGEEALSFTATNGAGKQFSFTKTSHGWRVFDAAGEIRQVKTNGLDMSILNFDRAYNLFSTTLAFKNSKNESGNVEASFVARDYKLKFTKENYRFYQLVETTNNNIALSRPIWGMMVGGGMKPHVSIVKRDNSGGYFLAFTDMFSRLCISAILEVLPDGGYVADPTVGPLSQPKDDPFIRGGVDHIIDLRQFADGERFFKDGGGVASASEKDRVLTLTVTNAAGSKFTFSNQDGQWHAYSFWGEINRVKK